MKFEELLEMVGDEPLFETGFLLAGPVDPANVHRQLSRWVKAGRLYQLRRGLYAVAPPFQRVRPHPGSESSGFRLLCEPPVGPGALLSDTGIGPGDDERHEWPSRPVGYTAGDLRFQAYPAWVSDRLSKSRPDRRDGCLPRDSREGPAGPRLPGAGRRLPGLPRRTPPPEHGRPRRKELHRLAEASGKPKLRRAADRIARLAEIEMEEYEPLW